MRRDTTAAAITAAPAPANKYLFTPSTAHTPPPKPDRPGKKRFVARLQPGYPTLSPVIRARDGGVKPTLPVFSSTCTIPAKRRPVASRTAGNPEIHFTPSRFLDKRICTLRTSSARAALGLIVRELPGGLSGRGASHRGHDDSPRCDRPARQVFSSPRHESKRDPRPKRPRMGANTASCSRQRNLPRALQWENAARIVATDPITTRATPRWIAP